MSVNINADTTNGLVLTSDTSGEIKLQSAGADIATVDSSGITMASGKTLPASSLTGTVPSGSLPDPLPAIDGSALTGISSYADSDALTLLNASGSAPVYACRAWVSLNGTGTIAINGSGNVSSIVDEATGRYRVNFTTAIQDTNYSAVTGGSILATQTSNEKCIAATNITTSSFWLVTHDPTGNSYNDCANVFGAIFR